jgi:hypothetical protein
MLTVMTMVPPTRGRPSRPEPSNYPLKGTRTPKRNSSSRAFYPLISDDLADVTG